MLAFKRLRRKQLAGGALVFASAGLVLANHKSENVADLSQALQRSSRAVWAFTLNSIDYKYSMRNHDKGTEDYYELLSEVHLRAAKRILKLCEANRGFYTKAGQFISSLQQFPKEYVETLRVLQDQAHFWPYKSIEIVFLQEFGKKPSEIYQEFDEKPLAAASLAQVHHAWLNDEEEVAVKIQYPGLERQFEIDIATMAIISKCVAWLFSDYQFEWLVPEFEKNLLKELDFVQEAKNAEAAAANFVNKREVKVPSIYWDHTTKRVLTMEFVHGSKVDDVEALANAGIDPKQVSEVLLQCFAEMIFCHGLVHGDPHPGNILVSQNPSAGGRYNFQIVLLDHGLYRQLDEDFRSNFCRLWRAMIRSNTNEVMLAGAELGAGEYCRFLPVILTGRTIDSKSALGKGMTPEERARLRDEVRRFSLGEISLFMEGLSRDFLLVLRTDGLLRSIVNRLGAPRQLRLQTYARYALLGGGMVQSGKPGLYEQGILRYSRSSLEYAYLLLRLGASDFIRKLEAVYRIAVSQVAAWLSKLRLQH